jgi:hypothetical protein
MVGDTFSKQGFIARNFRINQEFCFAVTDSM